MARVYAQRAGFSVLNSRTLSLSWTFPILAQREIDIKLMKDNKLM